MPIDLNQFAVDFGIDPATLTAKADVAAKYNTYFTEAATKYETATRAQREAEEKLSRVQSEQEAINNQIAQFGMTEANVAALRANNAQLEAALKSMKEQGFDVNIPEAPKVNEPAKPQFDPDRFRQDVNSTLIEGFNANNRYQRLYGKALPDDVDVLAREAAQARKPFSQYVADKYDFSGEEKRQAEANQAKRDAEIAQKAIEEYKTKNPVVMGNPELMRGVPSRSPLMQVQREAPDKNKFAGLSVREKIAQSVARSRAAVNTSRSA